MKMENPVPAMDGNETNKKKSQYPNQASTEIIKSDELIGSGLKPNNNVDVFDLQKYKVGVEHFANSQSDAVISNSSAEHARIIQSNIFRTAEYYIYIFAGTLNGPIANDPNYLDKLSCFLDRPDIRFKLILENQPQQPLPKALQIVMDAMGKYGDRISVGVLQNNINPFGDPPKHFTIADDRMFRREDDIDNYLASASFNQPDETIKLRRVFESLKSIAIG